MSLDNLEGLLRVEERTVSGREKIYSAIEEDARDILRNPVFQEYYTSRNYTHQELTCMEVYNLGKECLKIQMDRMGITEHFWINNNSAETNLKDLNLITLSLIRNLHRIKLAEKGKSLTSRKLEEIYKSRTKQNSTVVPEQNCAIKSNEGNLPRSVLPSTQSGRIGSLPNPEISSVPSKLPEPIGAKKGGGYSIKSRIYLVSPDCFNKYNAWVTSGREKVIKNDETRNHSEKEKEEMENKGNDIVVEKVKELTKAFTEKSKDEVTVDEDSGWSDEDEDCNATPKININLVQSRKKTESNDSGFLYDAKLDTATENGSQMDSYSNHKASVIPKLKAKPIGIFENGSNVDPYSNYKARVIPNPDSNPTLWSKTDPKFTSLSGSSSEPSSMPRVKSDTNSNSMHNIKPNTDLNDNSGLFSDSSPKLGLKIEPSFEAASGDSGSNESRNPVSNYDLKKTEPYPVVPLCQSSGQLEPESDEDEFEPSLKNIPENLSLADALKIPAVWRKIYMKGEPVPKARKPLCVPGQFEDPIAQDSTQISDCSCNRSIRMIHCGLCGFAVEGRIRKVCYLHSNVTYLHDFTACPSCKTGLNHLKEYCLPNLNKTKPEVGSEKKSSNSPSFLIKARSTTSTILDKSGSCTPIVSQKSSSGPPTVEKNPSSCPSTVCQKTKSGFSAIQEKPRSRAGPGNYPDENIQIIRKTGPLVKSTVYPQKVPTPEELWDQRMKEKNERARLAFFGDSPRSNKSQNRSARPNPSSESVKSVPGRVGRNIVM